MIVQVVIEPLFFKRQAGGTSTVESDPFLESTKLSPAYAEDQLSCYAHKSCSKAQRHFIFGNCFSISSDTEYIVNDMEWTRSRYPVTACFCRPENLVVLM